METSQIEHQINMQLYEPTKLSPNAHGLLTMEGGIDMNKRSSFEHT